LDYNTSQFDSLPVAGKARFLTITGFGGLTPLSIRRLSDIGKSGKASQAGYGSVTILREAIVGSPSRVSILRLLSAMPSSEFEHYTWYFGY